MLGKKNRRFRRGWSELLITDAVKTPTFANHESFHLRYGWLKKAYNAVIDNPKIFVSDDAPVRLGVGKNMVRAIRFWSLASKTFQPTDAKGAVEPTPIGHAIFGNDGLDPYLEDPQTLWLLHWLTIAPPCRIPVWWIILNEFSATNIKIEELTRTTRQRIFNVPKWKAPSPKSIKKDVDVFIHTYTTEQGKLAIEDYLDCPFRQMRMVKQSSRDTMRFVFGRKYGMTPKIMAFACLDFIGRLGIPSKSVSVTKLATEPGSVGHAFKIGENDLADMLNDACMTSDSIRVDNINGSQHLVFDEPESHAEKMLGAAYGRKGFRLPKSEKIEVLVS